MGSYLLKYLLSIHPSRIHPWADPVMSDPPNESHSTLKREAARLWGLRVRTEDANVRVKNQNPKSRLSRPAWCARSNPGGAARSLPSANQRSSNGSGGLQSPSSPCHGPTSPSPLKVPSFPPSNHELLRFQPTDARHLPCTSCIPAQRA